MAGDLPSLPISPTTDDRKALEVSGTFNGPADEAKKFKKNFNKVKIDENGSLTGWIFERDVAKYAQFRVLLKLVLLSEKMP